MPALVATSSEPLLEDVEDDADVSEAAAAVVAEDVAASVVEEDMLDVDEKVDCIASGPLGAVGSVSVSVTLIAVGSEEDEKGSTTLWLIPCASSVAAAPEVLEVGVRVVKSPPVQPEEVKVV